MNEDKPDEAKVIQLAVGLNVVTRECGLMNAKEIAKFFSGFAANQVLMHGAFALAGTEFTVLGIRYTPTLNATAVVIWAIILIALFYYSWIKR